MKIDFTLKVRDGSPELFAALTKAIAGSGGSVEPVSEKAKARVTTAPKPEVVVVASTPAAPEEAQPEVQPEAEAETPAETGPADDNETPDTEKKDPIGQQGAPATLRKSMEAIGRPTTATLKLADGVTSRPGDYVKYNDEMWVISVAYRGRALLENEAGDGVIAEAKHIVSAPDEDIPIQDNTPDAPITGEVVQPTAEDVRDLYVKVSTTVSPTRANDLMRKLAQGKRLTELSDEELDDAYKVLTAEISKFEAS